MTEKFKLDLLFVKITVWFLLTNLSKDGYLCAQRTYRRNCECEYAVDGKCGYSIVLPASFMGQTDQQASCPSPPVFNSNNNNNNNSVNNNNYSNPLLQELLVNISKILDGVIVDLENERNLVKDLNATFNSWHSSFACIVNQTNCSVPFGGDTNLDSQGNHSSNSLLGDIKAINESLKDIQDNIINLNDELSKQNQRILLLEESDIRFCSHPSLVIDSLTPIEATNITVYSFYGGTAYDNQPFPKELLKISNDTSFWCASEPSRGEEYIQFDLGRDSVIYGVLTKGRSNVEQWVTSYRVRYAGSNVSEIDNSTQWITVGDPLGLTNMTFQGNEDKVTAKVNYFDRPIKSRFVRYIPLTTAQIATGFSNKCTRIDLIYCANRI